MFFKKECITAAEYEVALRKQSKYMVTVEKDKIKGNISKVKEEVNKWGYRLTHNEVKLVVFVAMKEGLEINIDLIDNIIDNVRDLKRKGYDGEDILILRLCGYDYQYLAHIKDIFKGTEKSNNITKRLLRMKGIDYKQYRRECIFLEF